MAPEKPSDLVGPESIEALSAVRRGKPRKFVMLVKGQDIVSLVVYKKGTLATYLKEAKESGRGTPYYGVITGKGENINFQISRAEGFTKSPVKTQTLRSFLQDEADFKCKPLVEVVDEVGPALDDDDPLVARFLALQDRVLAFCDQNPAQAASVSSTCAAIGKLLDANPEDKLVPGRLDALEKLLSCETPASTKTEAATTTSSKPAEAETPTKSADATPSPLDQFKARLTALLKQAAPVAGAVGNDIKVFANQATKLAGQNDFDGANQVLLRIGQTIKNELTAPVAPPAKPAAPTPAELEAAWKKLKNSLYPQIKTALEGNSPNRDEILTTVGMASKAEKAGNFAEAIRLFESIAGSLSRSGAASTIPPPPPPPPPSGKPTKPTASDESSADEEEPKRGTPSEPSSVDDETPQSPSGDADADSDTDTGGGTPDADDTDEDDDLTVVDAGEEARDVALEVDSDFEELAELIDEFEAKIERAQVANDTIAATDGVEPPSIDLVENAEDAEDFVDDFDGDLDELYAAAEQLSVEVERMQLANTSLALSLTEPSDSDEVVAAAELALDDADELAGDFAEILALADELAEMAERSRLATGSLDGSATPIDDETLEIGDTAVDEADSLVGDLGEIDSLADEFEFLVNRAQIANLAAGATKSDRPITDDILAEGEAAEDEADGLTGDLNEVESLAAELKSLASRALASTESLGASGSATPTNDEALADGEAAADEADDLLGDLSEVESLATELESLAARALASNDSLGASGTATPASDEALADGEAAADDADDLLGDLSEVESLAAELESLAARALASNDSLGASGSATPASDEALADGEAAADDADDLLGDLSEVESLAAELESLAARALASNDSLGASGSATPASDEALADGEAAADDADDLLGDLSEVESLAAELESLAARALASNDSLGASGSASPASDEAVADGEGAADDADDLLGDLSEVESLAAELESLAARALASNDSLGASGSATPASDEAVADGEGAVAEVEQLARELDELVSLANDFAKASHEALRSNDAIGATASGGPAGDVAIEEGESAASAAESLDAELAEVAASFEEFEREVTAFRRQLETLASPG